MSFRVLIMIVASSLWCIFGFLFFYRSSWEPEDFRIYSGPLEEIGTKKVMLKRKVDVVFFHIRGLNQKLGIYQSKTLSKDKLMNNVNIGDTLTVYLDDYDVFTEDNIKLNVYHLQTRKKVFLDYRVLNRKHFRIGVILTSIGLVLWGFTIWFYRRDKSYTPVAVKRR